jgi:hypothetical protein
LELWFFTELQSQRKYFCTHPLLVRHDLGVRETQDLSATSQARQTQWVLISDMAQPLKAAIANIYLYKGNDHFAARPKLFLESAGSS